MQSIFNIINIIGDYSNKSIIIETNFAVDPATVNKKNIKVIDASSDTIVVYKLSVEDKNIKITLKEWPNVGQQYQVNVLQIKDMLDRNLVTPLTKIIEFKPNTKYKAEITYPNNNEAVIRNGNVVYFSMVRINPDGSKSTSPTPSIIDNIDSINKSHTNKEAIEEVDLNIKYHFEFASDIAFFNVVKDYSSEYTDGTIELDNAQYYMRARVIENDMPGDWSETITFTVAPYTDNISKDEILSEAQKEYLDEVFAPIDFFLDENEDLVILSKSPNGETLDEYYIEFNIDLDEEAIPEKIIAYRRDL